MKTVPQIVSPPSPVGLDALVLRFQNALSVLEIEVDAEPVNYFELLFGNIARRDEQTGEPIGFWQGKDYYPLMPDDNFRARGFFYVEDPSESGTNGYNFTYTLNFVVYYNQDLFKPGLDYTIKEFFINDVVRAITNLLRLEHQDSIRVYREQVFDDFELTDKTKFKFPLDGFRVQFVSDIEVDCGSVFTL